MYDQITSKYSVLCFYALDYISQQLNLNSEHSLNSNDWSDGKIINDYSLFGLHCDIILSALNIIISYSVDRFFTNIQKT